MSKSETARPQPEFSGPHGSPTLYETDLLASADPESVWVRIGQRIGVANLAFLLDEIGGGHIYVPARGNFFPALHQKAARLAIERLAVEGGSCAELAAAVGVSKSQAHKVRRRAVGTARKRKP